MVRLKTETKSRDVTLGYQRLAVSLLTRKTIVLRGGNVTVIVVVVEFPVSGEIDGGV